MFWDFETVERPEKHRRLLKSPCRGQILRLGRLFRLLRMLRLVRQMKEFDALFLMTTAIRSSFMVLGWTIILLFVCQMPLVCIEYVYTYCILLITSYSST